MASTDLDPRDTGRRIITGHQVGSKTAKGFGQHDRSTAMEDSERLMGALIHRHFAADKIGADRGDPDAEHPLDTHLYPLIYLDQVQRRLADVLVQLTTIMQLKTAQAYHSGA